jgi:hypothetical protein
VPGTPTGRDSTKAIQPFLLVFRVFVFSWPDPELPGWI